MKGQLGVTKVNTELQKEIDKIKANNGQILHWQLCGHVNNSFQMNMALDALRANDTVRILTISPNYCVDDACIYKLIEILTSHPNIVGLTIVNGKISDSAYIALAKVLETHSTLLLLKIKRDDGGWIKDSRNLKMGYKGAEAFIKAIKLNRSLFNLILQIEKDLKNKKELINAITSNPTICSAVLCYNETEYRIIQLPVKTLKDNPLRLDIFPALRSGDLDRVKKLIKGGLSVDSMAYTGYPSSGYSPLMLAARANDIAAVNLLLQYDRIPETKTVYPPPRDLNRAEIDEKGWAIVKKEVFQQYKGIITDEKILSDMMIIYTEDAGINAQEMAINRGFKEVANLIGEATEKRKTSVKSKSEEKYTDVIKDLKIVPEERQKVALRYLSKKEQLQLLLQFIDKNQVSDIELFLASGSTFESDNKKTSPIYKAVENSQYEICKLLIEAGASVNTVPLLPSAAAKENEDLIRLLVLNKANIDVKDNNENALHIAVKRNLKKVFSLLLELKADPNIPDSNKDTPVLNIAVNHKEEDIVRSLLIARADPNLEDKYQGEIALMSDQENLNITKQLIEAKSDINWIGKNGYTPLSKAACNGFQETTQLLVDSKANLAYVNKFSAAILPMVVESKKINEDTKLIMVKLLLASHANILSKKGNKTASQIANEANYRSLIKFLQPLEQATLSSSSVSSTVPLSNFKSVLPSETNISEKKGEFTINFTIEYSQLTIEEPPIGQGAFGVVYKGLWNSDIVAIKKLTGVDFNDNLVKNIELEARVMAQISTRSDNLVKLKGICLEKPNYCLVMEYMPNGNLYQFIHSSAEISYERCLSIGYRIAVGVTYLHEAEVLHRDLKSYNVLLDYKFDPKLADFGLAKIKNESSSSKSGIKGTPAWMAPELLDFKQSENDHTYASDIYSLGMILWELASRQAPYDKKTAMQVLALIMSGVRAYKTVPSDCPLAFKTLIDNCCDENPAKRPSAMIVANRLNTLWKERRLTLAPSTVPSNSTINSTLAYLSESRSYGGSYKPFEQLESLSSSIIAVEDKKNSATLQDALVTACEQGDFSAVKLAIQKGAMPFYSDSTGKQPIGAAVWGMSADILEYLLSQMTNKKSLTWEQIEKHNQEYYQDEIWLIEKFTPNNFAAWQALIEKMNKNLFIREIHLQLYNQQYQKALDWHTFSIKIGQRSPTAVIPEQVDPFILLMDKTYQDLKSKIKMSIDNFTRLSSTIQSPKKIDLFEEDDDEFFKMSEAKKETNSSLPELIVNDSNKNETGILVKATKPVTAWIPDSQNYYRLTAKNAGVKPVEAVRNMGFSISKDQN